MRVLLRKVVPLLCFLLLVGTLVAAASKVIDRWIVILDLRALLIGSIILIVKNVRHRHESRGPNFGQLALLPRSWQRWILGEDGQSKRRILKGNSLTT